MTDPSDINIRPMDRPRRPVPRSMPGAAPYSRGKTVRDWLGALGDSASIAEHARLLAGIQRTLASVLPPLLRTEVQVANFRQGTLVVGATNGAVAHRLRTLSGSVLDRLRAEGVAASTLKVEVRPPPVTPASAPKRAVLSTEARTRLEELSRNLPESPVREAVLRMIRQARR